MKMNLFRGRCSGTTILVFLQTLKEFIALKHCLILVPLFAELQTNFKRSLVLGATVMEVHSAWKVDQ